MRRELMSYFNCPGLDFCSLRMTSKFLQWSLKHASCPSSTGNAALSQSKYIYWPPLFYTEETNTYSGDIQNRLKLHIARHWSICFQIHKIYWPKSNIFLPGRVKARQEISNLYVSYKNKCLFSGKEWFGLWCRNRFYSLMQNLTQVCKISIYWKRRKSSYITPYIFSWSHKSLTRITDGNNSLFLHIHL